MATNVTTQPQLKLPIIPAGWCPVGSTLRDKFQYFVDTILSQAVISIPGLEDISLLDLASIQQQLTELQNNYAALNKQERSVTSALIEDGEISVNIVPNMPSASYNIMPVIVSPVGSAAVSTAFAITVVADSKSVTGFKVLCHNIPPGYYANFYIRQS